MAGFSVKKGQGQGKQGRASTRAYPTQVCMTQWRDPETGRLAKSPEQARAAQANGTRAKARKGRAIEDRAIVTRVKQDGEVTSARVVMQGARAAQRRGKLTAAEVRDLERDLSRDALEAFNPSRAGELHAERMHEAHRSDKAKRGASTKKRNAAAGVTRKKRRPVVEIQTQLLKAEELVRDAQRRHSSATTAKARARHGDSLRTRRARASKLRAELAAAQ